MRYEPAATNPTAKGCQTGTLALAGAIRSAFPELSTMSGPYGCYNRRRIVGSYSWSLHAEGRALDVGVDPPEHQIGWELACILVRDRVTYGVQRVMWDGHIWTIERLDEWQRLQPSSEQHLDHLHIEQYWSGALRPVSVSASLTRQLTAARAAI